MRRLIGTDDITGVSSWHEYDELTDRTTIIHTGDSQAYLDLNKERQNDAELTRQGIKNEFWLYASIPPMVQVKLLVEKGIDIYNKDHGPALSRVLEDPEYKYLKTTTRHHKIK